VEPVEQKNAESATVIARGAPIVFDNAVADYRRQIIGRLSAPNNRPIIGRLPIVYFRTHLRSISHIVTIVKSRWYNEVTNDSVISHWLLSH